MDTCAYVRNTYGVPARVGGRVKIGILLPGEQTGTITGADHHIFVMMDGESETRRFHPTYCITYLDEKGLTIAAYGDEDEDDSTL